MDKNDRADSAHFQALFGNRLLQNYAVTKRDHLTAL
jgi:hypothetical protein